VTSGPSKAQVTPGGRAEPRPFDSDGHRARIFSDRGELLLAAVGSATLVSTAVVAAVHVDDRYWISHVSGAWMALAQHANHGVLYPPLFDGSAFGGTRVMPLQIVLHAAAARISDEYLVSGKLLGYAEALLLFGVLVWLVRRISGSVPLAIALVSAILVTPMGFDAVHGVRGDTLPAALQLIAVAIALVGTPAAIAATGVLCALAFFSKLTAVWGLTAVALWLATRRRWRLLGGFFAAFLLPAALLFAIFYDLSEGRVVDNVLGLSGAGVGSPKSAVLDASRQLTLVFGEDALAIWPLVPLAFVSVVLGVRRKSPSIFHFSFCVAFLVLAAIMADIGAWSNHVLDVSVLSAVLVSDLWRQAALDARTNLSRALIIAILTWGVVLTYQATLRGATFDAARSLVAAGGPRFPARPLDGLIDGRQRILSDDPYIAVSRGESPVVLDAFMLLRLLDRHPDWRSNLIARIDAHSFSKVVLLKPLDPSAEWWRSLHFGPAVTSALQRNYRLRFVRDGYYVYVPR
jgi:hypothetical protein